jgi:hypothetical protein
MDMASAARIAKKFFFVEIQIRVRPYLFEDQNRRGAPKTAPVHRLTAMTLSVFA